MADTETASKRPFWVTLVAAIATVIVVLALAAGPTLSGCATSAEGFNSCVRSKLADIGLLPRAPLPVDAPATQSDDTEMTVADTDAGAPQAQSVMETPDAPESEVSEPEDVDTASSAEAATPEAEAGTDMQVANVEETPATDTPAVVAEEETPQPVETPAVDTPLPPLLGLVRVEPDGSLVVAGSAEPNAEIEIYANGELLGRTTAESSGDWVFVPDTPLPPGAAEITVVAPALGLTADRSVVVVVQEDRTTEPLVVASQPGEASEVLQGISEPETVPESEAETPMVVAESTTEEVAEHMDEPAQAPASEDEPAPEAESEMTAAPASESTEDAADDTMVTEEMDVAAAGPQDEPAAPSEPVVAIIPPSIDAIEIDGDKNFFAGSGEEGATIRLYINDGFIADTVVSDGRWLIETARNVLNDVSQRVRVDMLQPGSADVIGRAEVNFEIVLPEAPAQDTPEAPTVVADNAGQEAPEPETTTAADAVSDPASATESEPVDAPESAPADETEPASEAEEQPLVVADTSSASEPAADMQSEADSAPMAEPEAEAMPATETESEQPADTSAPASEPPATEADAEEVPTITAVQIGEDDQRFAAGRAIIRRGDNLWTIARRVYGEGVRYTTIYQANREQIRNPDLIYPGQVFALPGDAE